LINKLLQELEKKIDLLKFEDAARDIENDLLNQFYELIPEYQVTYELDDFNNIRNSGGNVDAYRKKPLS